MREVLVHFLSAARLLFFFRCLLLGTEAIGAGLQGQALAAGTIPKQEILMVSNLYVTVPEGLMGQDVPSPHLSNRD